MKTEKILLEKLILAVENYDPTTNGDVNSFITEGLLIHLRQEAQQILADIPDEHIKNAQHYLCDGGLSIEEQVELIANHKDQSDLIDDVYGVKVWQPLEGYFTCDEFLSTIGL